MSDRGKSLREELRTRVKAGVEAGLDLEQIRLQPRTQRVLDELFPSEELIADAQRQIIRGVIAEFVNEKGEREYVYVEQPRLDAALPASDMPATITAKASYVPLAEVAEDKPLRGSALLKLAKLIKGAIRRAGYIDAATKVQLMEAIDSAFARLSA